MEKKDQIIYTAWYLIWDLNKKSASHKIACRFINVMSGIFVMGVKPTQFIFRRGVGLLDDKKTSKQNKTKKPDCLNPIFHPPAVLIRKLQRKLWFNDRSPCFVSFWRINKKRTFSFLQESTVSTETLWTPRAFLKNL